MKGEIDHVIEFAEGSWDGTREVLISISELTTRTAATEFIARLGSDRYYARNAEMGVDQRRKSLLDRVGKASEN
ncbi:MAG: hypothetical protein ACI364_01705 [Coriobacteriales bacterium]